MAEIGLAASVIQLAGFGAAVAKNLYDAADVMIHANQQILTLAKHITHFTAVLKRMGEVLDAEGANCSKKVLRDIRSIEQSCEQTLGEIKAAVESKRSRYLTSVRWLFKRTKALELESRLSSHQSMLQCIISTLTVSKLGHMAERSKEDSQNISGLKDEITLLKTFIMESYTNLTELKYNESRAEMETKDEPNDSDDGNASVAASLPLSDDDPEVKRESSISDDGPRLPDEGEKMFSITYQNASPNTGKRRSSRGEIRKYSTRLPSTTKGLESGNVHSESNILLQMVPYRTNFLLSVLSDQPLPAVLGRGASRISRSKGVTESVRHLLDDWTVAGSAPISSILDEESSKEEDYLQQGERSKFTRFRATDDARSSSPRFGEFSDHFDASSPPDYHNYPPYGVDDFGIAPPPLPDLHMRRRNPHAGPPGPDHKEFWRSDHRFPSSYSQIGDEILDALRSSRGGIYYAKANHFRKVHYVDTRPIYTCDLVPWQFIPQKEGVPLSTEIGDGLVRREALDLLGYSFSKTEQGDFLIQGNLKLREIEELVKLSYQALNRKLTKQSRQIIEERGLSEAVNSMSLSMPKIHTPRPTPYRYSPAPSPPLSRSPTSPRSQPMSVDPIQSDDIDSDIARREVANTSKKVRPAHQERRLVPSEVPVPSSTLGTTEKTKAPMPIDAQVKKISAELQKFAGYELNLKYYAIPGIEAQIKAEKEKNNLGGVASGTRAIPAASKAKTTETEDTDALQPKVDAESADSDVTSGSVELDL